VSATVARQEQRPQGTKDQILNEVVSMSVPGRDESSDGALRRAVMTADGSCLGNPGPGGWAWVYDAECWAAGGHPRTTNNLMELRAVYEVLHLVPPQVPLLVQTDSTYVIQVFTQWLTGWQASGWRTSAKKPVANREPIEMTAALLVGRDLQWRHVPGHAGHVENEIADAKARAAATAIRDHKQPATGNPACLKQRLEQGLPKRWST